MIKIGGQFSSVGAFDYALDRLGIEYLNVYQAEWDKYARTTYLANHSTPKIYVEDVNDTPIVEITDKYGSLDIAMFSPPCFVGDTLINTDKGFIKIKDIRIGDLVLTHKNKYQKVIDFGSKKSEILILNAQGIIETRTTPNHKYYVREKYREWDNSIRSDVRKFTDPKWLEAKELTKNHFIGINIPQIEKNPFNISKEVAYVLGRYVADGWLRDRTNEIGKTKGNALVLAIGKDKLKDISEKIKLKHSINKQIKGVSKLFIFSNSLVKLVQDLGLGCGAINKRIPQSIINLPKYILQEFVNGYMDGDGHPYKDCFRATSVSKELLMGLQLCIAKLYKVNSNIKLIKTPDTTIIQGRVVNQKDYYILEFRKEMRKQSNAIVIDDKIWYPVRNIEMQEEKETVYDITVENDNSYTANQAIVHNCQSFSLAGKRSGKEDLKGRGVLFFNSLEFIEVNKPRFFIFENVKGLLSDNKKDKSSEIGQTFSEWLNLLGGKSVNGNVVMFPYEGSVPYHIYWSVLNAKNYGVPQNRERVFIVGIRDDQDNDFKFPKAFPLTKRLKDVLEPEVEEKYYLSEKLIQCFKTHAEKEKGNGFEFKTKDENDIANSILTKEGTRPCDNYIKKIGFVNQDTQASQVFSVNGISPSICAGTHGYANGYIDKPIVVHNLSGSKWDKMHEQSRRVYDVNGIGPAMHTCGGGNQEPKILQLNDSKESNNGTQPYQQNRVYDSEGIIPSLCQGKSDLNILIPEKTKKGFAIAEENDCIYLDRPHQKRGVVQKGKSQTIKTSGNDLGVFIENRIRKLTPTECFRLMDFPDSLVKNARKVGVSNSQLYKQAGNSIVVGVLALIIKNLKL